MQRPPARRLTCGQPRAAHERRQAGVLGVQARLVHARLQLRQGTGGEGHQYCECAGGVSIASANARAAAAQQSGALKPGPAGASASLTGKCKSVSPGQPSPRTSPSSLRRASTESAPRTAACQPDGDRPFARKAGGRPRMQRSRSCGRGAGGGGRHGQAGENSWGSRACSACLGEGRRCAPSCWLLALTDSKKLQVQKHAPT